MLGFPPPPPAATPPDDRPALLELVRRTPELDRLIQRALAKAPGARHRDVLALASELRAGLQLQPREQLRSLAAVWDARARSPALLLKSNDLMATPKVVGELERAFIAESR